MSKGGNEMKEIIVFLVGENRNEAQILEEMKKFKAVQIREEMVALENLRDLLARTRPHLIIYDASEYSEEVEQSAGLISQLFPEIVWAVLSNIKDSATILRFFRQGAFDFLQLPIDPEEVKRLLQKVIDLDRRQSANGKEEHRKTVAVFSTKGGVGTSTLSVNLACELAKQKESKVILIDMVLQHGNIGDLLDVPPKYTLIDTLENFERLDSKLLENTLIKHETGLFVLPCPKEPEDADFITSKEISEVFHFFKGMFHYVIADLGHEFSKSAISFLDLADMVLLVTTPDVPSLNNARGALNVMKRLGYNEDKVKVVLNHWKMKGEIESAVIQKTLGMNIWFRIPHDPQTALTAANLGKPISQVSKKSELAKAFFDLSVLIHQNRPKEVPRHVAA